MTKPVVLIHGPQASGKTRNAEAFKKLYDCDRIVEYDEPRNGSIDLLPGDLVLTNRGTGVVSHINHSVTVIYIAEALVDLRSAGGDPREPFPFDGLIDRCVIDEDQDWEAIRQQEFHPARDAFQVSTIWATPKGDQSIAYLARVSNSKAQPDDPGHKLIEYLLRNHHWSPFEMASLTLEIRTQRDISAQILRHRSFSFQEFSTRYAEVEELLAVTECRFQDTTNRQSSFTMDQLTGDFVDDAEATVAYFDAVINETRTRSLEAYAELLRRGVAKEVARRILPIGLIPTKLYMNGTVRSWLHYCSERTKPGVQKEHRMIAIHALNELFMSYPQTVKAAIDSGAFQMSDEDRAYFEAMAPTSVAFQK